MNGVKITLIMSLTILTSSVLFISYNEYTNRYSLIPTSDNGLYIFDKKSTILNKCNEKGCSIIETKLPSKTSFPVDQIFSPSQTLSQQKPMAKEIAEPSNNLKQNETRPEEKIQNKEVTEPIKKDEKEVPAKTENEKEIKKSSEKSESKSEEFVE